MDLINMGRATLRRERALAMKLTAMTWTQKFAFLKAE
jgi:hypothetical protein